MIMDYGESAGDGECDTYSDHHGDDGGNVDDVIDLDDDGTSDGNGAGANDGDDGEDNTCTLSIMVVIVSQNFSSQF